MSSFLLYFITLCIVDVVYWVAMPCGLSGRYQHFGDSMFLQNLGVHLGGLRLAQPGGPTARVSVLPLFYLKTKEDPASET
jgi:hypothetical protein